MTLAAVILAGGGGTRLGGADKAGLVLEGRTLLERSLGAVAEVEDVVVAGPAATTSREVRFVLEDPAGGGPAAGLLTALADGFEEPPALVVVLAVDLPGVSPATVRRLMLAADRDGALLVDADGRRQYLCGVYDVPALLAAAGPRSAWHSSSMRALLEPLRLAEVESVGDESSDVDTWADLHRLRGRELEAEASRAEAGDRTE